MNAMFRAGYGARVQSSRIAEEPPMKTIIIAAVFAMTAVTGTFAAGPSASTSVSSGQTTTSEVRATCTVKIKEATIHTPPSEK